MKPEIYLMYTTCPDQETALLLAEALVEGHLAACVNLLPAVTSVYRWQGKLERSAEVLLLAKTTPDRLPQLQETLRSKHPYELPEIIAVPVTQGLAPYLDWVRQACQSNAS